MAVKQAAADEISSNASHWWSFHLFFQLNSKLYGKQHAENHLLLCRWKRESCTAAAGGFFFFCLRPRMMTRTKQVKIRPSESWINHWKVCRKNSNASHLFTSSLAEATFLLSCLWSLSLTLQSLQLTHELCPTLGICDLSFFFFFSAGRAFFFFFCHKGIDDGFWSISWIYRSKSRASLASLSWLATITAVSRGPSWFSLVLPRHFSLSLRDQSLLMCDDEVQQWPSTLDSPFKVLLHLPVRSVTHTQISPSQYILLPNLSLAPTHKTFPN